jgi:hypothetical protein
MLPFTLEQFTDVFVAYNIGVWPAQVVAYLAGFGMIVLVLRPSKTGHRIVGAALAAMWVWTGVAYHGLYFSAINKAALIFGALFVLQGLVLFHAAVISSRLRFGPSSGPTAWLGWTFVIYASIIYPLIGLWAGHRYPGMPMFGITPCPLTIFTLGLLSVTTAPVSWWLLLIPFIWSLIGGSAAFLLGVPQDWPLLLSGIAILLIVLRDQRRLPSTISA